MKCHQGIIVGTTIATLIITVLATFQLHNWTGSGFLCWKCSSPGYRGYTKHTQETLSQQLSKSDSVETLMVNNSKDASFPQVNTSALPEMGGIRAPVHCVKINCREHLSSNERDNMKSCENRVRRVEHIMGPIKNSDCKFLPRTGHHPVALLSARGSGNTWTRGLLEKASGVCTGFIFCDSVMRAHGYVGESVKSGKVLVVKTHSPNPKWVGGSNSRANSADPNYASAVFILRNPFNAAVAEWNRRSAQEILGKHNYTISQERHTYVVPKELFSKFMQTCTCMWCLLEEATALGQRLRYI